jgi:hypothetical protein
LGVEAYRTAAGAHSVPRQLVVGDVVHRAGTDGQHGADFLGGQHHATFPRATNQSSAAQISGTSYHVSISRVHTMARTPPGRVIGVQGMVGVIEQGVSENSS